MTGFLASQDHEMLVEFAHIMTGECLGSGMSRTVYLHPDDDTKIIKFERLGYFQNANEWQFWGDWKDNKDVAKYLAPCHRISYNGRMLVMDRAFDIRLDELPKMLPSWITDHDISNFGKIGKRIVCRDYGYVRQRLELSMRKWKQR